MIILLTYRQSRYWPWHWRDIYIYVRSY